MKIVIRAGLALALAATAALCGCSGTPAESSRAAAPATYDESTTIVEPTVKTTGGRIRINDNTLGEIWITELAGVNLNSLDASGFTADADFKYYSENGKPASHEGIDVSSFSGDIDWKKVKASGVDFVMVRLGGRGYGDEGALYSDDKALENINGAREAGLKVGAYFYSQAISVEEAVEEADYANEILSGSKLDYPLAYDWEIVKNDDARTDTVSSAQATACAAAFCNRVKELGYIPMIYSASREFYFKYDLSQLADFDLWLCEYSDVPNFYYQFSMWQYSESGSVDGIDTPVDLNICFSGVADYD